MKTIFKSFLMVVVSLLIYKSSIGQSNQNQPVGNKFTPDHWEQAISIGDSKGSNGYYEYSVMLTPEYTIMQDKKIQIVLHLQIKNKHGKTIPPTKKDAARNSGGLTGAVQNVADQENGVSGDTQGKNQDKQAQDKANEIQKKNNEMQGKAKSPSTTVLKVKAVFDNGDQELSGNGQTYIFTPPQETSKFVQLVVYLKIQEESTVTFQAASVILVNQSMKEQDEQRQILYTEQAKANKTLKLSETNCYKLKDNIAYWFARLYYYITLYEIENSYKFEHPDFMMHFISVFYQMYNANLQSYLAGGKQYTNQWGSYFEYCAENNYNVNSKIELPTTVAEASINGVIAHIKGDMEEALVKTFEEHKKLYNQPYQFDDYKTDFFETNRQIFDQVKTAFINEVGKKWAASEKTADYAQKLGVGINIDEIYQWRSDEWENAKKKLIQMGITK